MATPRTVVSTIALSETVERLLLSCQKLTTVIQLMTEAGMSNATLPWTNAHWMAADRLIEAGGAVESAIHAEIAAFKGKRPSRAFLEKKRAVRDAERRKAKKATEGVAPKKRGRPRKSAS